jgi:hypothetical protein
MESFNALVPKNFKIPQDAAKSPTLNGIILDKFSFFKSGFPNLKNVPHFQKIGQNSMHFHFDGPEIQLAIKIKTN